MVVVTIVSVLSVGVLLGVGGGSRLMPGTQAGDVQRHGDALGLLLERGRDTALFRRQPAGLQPLRSGWVLVGYDARTEGWTHLQPVHQTGAAAEWTVAGRAYPAPATQPGTAPPIRIRADGGVTPFSLRLGAAGSRLTCRVDGASALRCGIP